MRVSNSELFTTINTAFDALAKTKSFEELQPVVNASAIVSESVQEKDNFWQELLSLICSVFGYVTEFKQLQLDAKHLQTQLDQRLTIFSYSEAIHLNATSLSELQALQALREADPLIVELRSQLNDIQSSMRDLSHLISNEAKTLLAQFNYVEEMINQLEEQNCASTLDQKLRQANDAATFLKTIEGSIYEMSTIYDENSYDLTAIIPLVNSYESVVVRLQLIQDEIQTQLLDQNSEVINKFSVERFCQIGGIRNGGNTCYLASAIQTVNVIPAYRRVFDPRQNPLRQRRNETDTDFTQRQDIQQRGFRILQAINSGVQVEPEEINAFRRACYNYQDQGTRIVDTAIGFADSAETLHRLLEAMDYKLEIYSINETTTPVGADQYTVVTEEEIERERLNLNGYEEFSMNSSTRRTNESNLQLSALNYLNATVPMQQLIDESWQQGTVHQKFLGFTSENDAQLRNYTFNRSRTPNVAEAPEVIKITILQFDGQRAKLSGAESVYPFGNGRGPRYELKAAIEHRPGHYVAHLFQNGRILEANDSWVHMSQADLPAFAYYYVRSGEA